MFVRYSQLMILSYMLKVPLICSLTHRGLIFGMARTTIALNLVFAWAYGNRNLGESVVRGSDFGSAGDTVVSPASLVSVETVSLAEAGTAEEEQKPGRIAERAHWSDEVSSVEKTLFKNDKLLQQQLDGKASELSEKIAREDSVIFQSLNARIGMLDKEIKRVEKMMYGGGSRK